MVNVINSTGLITGALVSMIMTVPAFASPTIGDTISCSATNFSCSVASARVNSGNEFGLNFGSLGTLLTANFSDGLLTLSNANNPDISAFSTSEVSASFIDTTSPFTLATLGTVSGIINYDHTAFDQSRISLADGLLRLNLGEVIFPRNSFVTIQLGSPSSAVPEPASWVLMLAGFGFAGYAMRNRSLKRVDQLGRGHRANIQ